MSHQRYLRTEAYIVRDQEGAGCTRWSGDDLGTEIRTFNHFRK